jgi:heme/copper-type cytochrome/quinol oxidase subunit 2
MNGELLSIRTRAKTAIILMWAALIINTMLSALGYFVEELHWEDDKTAYLLLVTVLSSVSFINVIISASAFIRWFYVSYANLHKRFSDLKYKKQWAVFGWFVPIVNLVVPYKIMEEMHLKIAELVQQSDTKERIERGLFDFWWGLFIVSVVAETMVVANAIKHSNITAEKHVHGIFDTMTVSYMFSIVVTFTLAFITTKIISDYSKAEEELFIQEQSKAQADENEVAKLSVSVKA